MYSSSEVVVTFLIILGLVIGLIAGPEMMYIAVQSSYPTSTGYFVASGISFAILAATVAGSVVYFVQKYKKSQTRVTEIVVEAPVSANAKTVSMQDGM